MNSNKVLILGGGGFIGSCLARRLCHKGHEVHIITPRPFDPQPFELSEGNFSLHYGSMDNPSLPKRVLPRCNTIIHLASATTPTDSDKNPIYEVEKNLMPTVKFLELIQQWAGNLKFIFISSGGAIYTPREEKPITENQALHPKSYYGAGKIAIESFLKAYAGIHNMDTVILRPSNLYGPGQPLKAGFGLIRTMLAHIQDRTTMEIWGDGEIVRDFVYIDDMITLLDRIIETPDLSGTYNVGFCQGYSINQVKEIVEDVTGRTLKAEYINKRKVDIHKVVIDSKKLRHTTGWHPVVPLKLGISHTWNWLVNEGHPLK